MTTKFWAEEGYLTKHHFFALAKVEKFPPISLKIEVGATCEKSKAEG